MGMIADEVLVAVGTGSHRGPQTGSNHVAQRLYDFFRRQAEQDRIRFIGSGGGKPRIVFPLDGVEPGAVRFTTAFTPLPEQHQRNGAHD